MQMTAYIEGKQAHARGITIPPPYGTMSDYMDSWWLGWETAEREQKESEEIRSNETARRVGGRLE